MKNKKGFTLVEIIVCIALIALIATVSFISLRKGSDDGITDNAKKELETATDVFIEKTMSDGTYKSYETVSSEDSSQIETISCISPESLINKGYLTQDNEYYKYLKENNLYLKVISSSIGTLNYEEIPETEATCYTYEDKTDFVPKTDTPSIGNLTSDGYEFKQYIEADTGNNYIYKLDYQFNLKSIEKITIDIPLYVVIVLDESGSMIGRQWTNAKTAVETLSKKIVDIGSSNQVALVKFGNSYTVSQKFSHSYILAKNITFASAGSTCYSCGLKGAYELLNASSFKIATKKRANSKFFVVFLSDGGDNKNKSERSTYVNKIKNLITDDYGKLITVAYEYSGSVLSDMASTGCDTDNGKCYYDNVKIDEIEEMFSSLASTMIEQATCSEYKKAKVVINLSENFTSTSSSNLHQIVEEIPMNCDSSTLELTLPEMQTITQKILYNPNATCNEDECIITENIVDERKGAVIEFYNEKGKLVGSESLTADKFPSVTLTLKKYSVIN